MNEYEEIIVEIETRIKALQTVNIAAMEKAQVHILSARLMSLTEKLNSLAYSMLYMAEETNPTDPENFKKLR